jgi:hypothetical protein
VLGWQQFQEAGINAPSGITKGVRSDGIGTLIFGGTTSTLKSLIDPSFYGNTGLDILQFSIMPQLGFFDIMNANQVYKTIMEIKTKGV